MPIITVLIPMYNRQQYIEECIRSVQKQSWKKLDILLVDDGSSDNTVEICQKLSQEDPRIRILLSAHGGVSAARNIGLEAAKGKYVFFLDSDDVIHPLLLETLVLSMDQNNVPLSGTQCTNVSEGLWDKVPQLIAQDSIPGDTDYKDHQNMLHEVFTTASPLSVIGGVMMRRDWIGETRFRTDLYIGEDFYFIYENMIKGADAVFLQQKWYYCRLHKSNSSWDFAYSGFMNRLYRRELVWKSEEKLGRQAYANTQKMQVFSFLKKFLDQDSLCDNDKEKIRKTMKQYRKTLFPAFSWKTKLQFIIYVYLPHFIPLLLWILKKRSQKSGM